MASICRLLSSPSALRLHNFGRFRPFSMSSVKDHVTRVESTVEEAVPWECDRNRPYLPVPRGFPFSIEDYPHGVGFMRKDKDERTLIRFHLNGHHSTNGSLSYGVQVEVRRGFWYAQLDTLVGPEMCRILAAKVSEKRDHHLKCYEEILDSKGINARQIVDLFTKQVKANVSTR